MASSENANFHGFNVESAATRGTADLIVPPLTASFSAAPISPARADEVSLVAELRAQLAAKDEVAASLRAELDALRQRSASIASASTSAQSPAVHVSTASPTAAVAAAFSSLASPLAAAELEISVMMLDSASSMQTSFILSAVASKFRRMLQAERCSVYLIDEERDELWTTVADGIDIIRIPLHSGIVGHSIRIGQCVNVADAYQSPYLNAELDRQSGFHTRSVLCGPIRDRSGAIIGAVQMLNKLPPSTAFSNQDVEILNVFIKHAGSALEFAQRHERTQELASLSHRRAQLSIDLLNGENAIPTLRESIDLYRRCCRADMCTVFVCPPSAAAAAAPSQAPQLLPASFVHTHRLELHPQVRAAMAAKARQRIDWVFRTAQPLLLPAKAPASLPRQHANRGFAAPFSYLAIPLANAKTGSVIGVLEMRRMALPVQNVSIAPEMKNVTTEVSSASPSLHVPSTSTDSFSATSADFKSAPPQVMFSSGRPGSISFASSFKRHRRISSILVGGAAALTAPLLGRPATPPAGADASAYAVTRLPAVAASQSNSLPTAPLQSIVEGHDGVQYEMPEAFGAEELALARALAIHVAHTLSYTLTPEQFVMSASDSTSEEVDSDLRSMLSADNCDFEVEAADLVSSASDAQMEHAHNDNGQPSADSYFSILSATSASIPNAPPSVASTCVNDVSSTVSISGRRVSFSPPSMVGRRLDDALIDVSESIGISQLPDAQQSSVTAHRQAQSMNSVASHSLITSNSSVAPPAVYSLVQSIIETCHGIGDSGTVPSQSSSAVAANTCTVWLTVHGTTGERTTSTQHVCYSSSGASESAFAAAVAGIGKATHTASAFSSTAASTDVALCAAWHSSRASASVSPPLVASQASQLALQLGCTTSCVSASNSMRYVCAPIFAVPTQSSIAIGGAIGNGIDIASVRTGIIGVIEMAVHCAEDGENVSASMAQVISSDAGLPSSVFNTAQFSQALGVRISAALTHADEHAAAVAARVRCEYILQMMQDVSAEPQTRRLIQRVMSGARALLRAERCTVFIVDRVNQTLWSTVADGADEIRLPMHVGIAGAVAASGSVANIADAYDDPRFDRTIDAITGYRTRAMLCAPIRHPIGGVIGVLQVINKVCGSSVGGAVGGAESLSSFTAEDERLVLAVSSHVGISLYNAQLYERTLLSHRRSEALMQIMKASSSSSSIATVMQRMVLATHNLLLADEVVLFLVDSARGEFYCRVMRDRTDIIRESIGSDEEDRAIAAEAEAVSAASEEPESAQAVLDEVSASNRPHDEAARQSLAAPLARQMSVGTMQRRAVLASVEAYTARQGGVVNIRDVRRDERFAVPSVGGVENAAKAVHGTPSAPASLVSSSSSVAFPVLCVAACDREGRPVAVIRACMKRTGSAASGVDAASKSASTTVTVSSHHPHEKIGRSHSLPGDIAQAAANANALAAAAAMTPMAALLLDHRVLPTSLNGGPGGNGATGDLPELQQERVSELNAAMFGSNTRPVEPSPAASVTSFAAFTAEDEYLLQSMASEIASVLKRRSLEATFQSLVADTENLSSDSTSKALLGQYLRQTQEDGGDTTAKVAHKPASLRSESGVAVSFESSASASASSHTSGGAATTGATAEFVSQGDVTNRTGDVLAPSSAETTAEAAARRQAAREAVLAASGTILAMTPSSHVSAASLHDPDFDVWAYSCNELLSFSVEIFSAFRYFDACGTAMPTLKAFLVAVHNGYNDHAYHNFRHGFGVLHVVYLLMTRGGAMRHLDYLEVAALCIASLCHDINHNGLNNAYYVNSSHELALVYNDISVLENMHASNTLRILKKRSTNILEHLPAAEYKQVRKTIVSAILHTDMADHFDLTNKLRALVEDGNFSPRDNKQHRELLIGAMIHSADLSNPVLPRDSAVRWSKAVYQEFNRQAELEKRDHLPVAPFMETTSFAAQAKMNVDFIDFIVSPLWVALSDLLGTNGSDLYSHYLGNMRANRAYWKSVNEIGNVSASAAAAAAAATTKRNSRLAVAQAAAAAAKRSPGLAARDLNGGDA